MLLLLVDSIGPEFVSVGICSVVVGLSVPAVCCVGFVVGCVTRFVGNVPTVVLGAEVAALFTVGSPGSPFCFPRQPVSILTIRTSANNKIAVFFISIPPD